MNSSLMSSTSRAVSDIFWRAPRTANPADTRARFGGGIDWDDVVGEGERCKGEKAEERWSEDGVGVVEGSIESLELLSAPASWFCPVVNLELDGGGSMPHMDISPVAIPPPKISCRASNNGKGVCRNSFAWGCAYGMAEASEQAHTYQKGRSLVLTLM
jgi:hypothetical protein